jgi:hypothetical protein
MFCKTALDDKIVIFGQSCSGKTTFAKQLTDHYYYCFDALFPWHLIETFGLSITTSLHYIKAFCEATPKYVLDGWHLADKEGKLLPEGCAVYVVYCSYEQVLKQYRVEVTDPNEYWGMYQKWYGIDYEKLPGVRYFLNSGEFLETTREEFLTLLSEHSQ